MDDAPRRAYHTPALTTLFLLALVLAIWGDVEQQRWALGALMTILGSILGFLVGQKA
ncbi:hypothetical protein [Cystobacter ferrugineus]|uniref:hypothetical protein n=1 Tax=Cystobacter ferrugineus TaxID=83449 RepID=UPI000AEEA42F|nr:hypothetical protein [Cystobacter ferrugineus]